MNGSNVVAGVLLAALLTTWGYIWKEKTRYTAVSVTCPTGTGECVEDAAFTSLHGCEFYNEIANMGCEFSPDRRSVSCKVAPKPLALGHCEVRK